MSTHWIYTGTGRASEIDAAHALAHDLAVWVPGNLLDRDAPQPQPGDWILLFWREHGTDTTGIFLGAARLGRAKQPWGGVAWLETVRSTDSLYARARELGYRGPRNYMTMACLDAWEEDVAAIRRLLGTEGVPKRLEPGRRYRGLPPGTFLKPWAGAALEPAETPEDPLMERIIVDPAVLQGKPIIRGLRIAVEHVLGWLAAGSSEAEILAEFPELEHEDIQACLEYARRLVGNEQFYPSVKSS